jgi:hypothetical protein
MAARPVRPVQHRRRRSLAERAHERARGALAVTCQPQHVPARREHDPHWQSQEVELLQHPIPDAAGDHVELVRGRLGLPVIGLVRGRLGRRVEQQGGKLDGGDPVDHAVMRLADESDPPVLELVGDRHLPKRPAAVERRRHHPIDDVREAGLARVPDMARDVEAVVVDPERVVQAEWNRLDLLAVARGAREPARDVIAHLDEPRRRSVGGWREQRDPAHVHVGGRRLHLEEGGVKR